MKTDADSMDITPEMALTDALSMARSESPDKCLVLFLWDGDSKYDTRFFNAGMSLSQMVSLLEVNKAKFINMMTNQHED